MAGHQWACERCQAILTCYCSDFLERCVLELGTPPTVGPIVCGVCLALGRAILTNGTLPVIFVPTEAHLRFVRRFGRAPRRAA